MIALNFPQANMVLAKDQDQYNNLPAFFGQIGSTEEQTGFVFGFELSDEELNVINNTRQIWSSQLTFGNPLNPVQILAHNPFEHKKIYSKSVYNTSDLVSFGNFLLSGINQNKYHVGGEFNKVFDSDLANWDDSYELESPGLTARETQMYELLQFVNKELQKGEVSLKLKMQVNQLVKEINI